MNKSVFISKQAKAQFLKVLEKELKEKIQAITICSNLTEDEKQTEIQALKLNFKKKKKELGFSLF